MKLTSEEYVAQGGNACPFCGSGHLEGDSIQSDSAMAWQRVSCNDCGKVWRDLYTLTGWADVFSEENES